MHKVYCHQSELDNEHVTMRCVDFKEPIEKAITSGFVEFVDLFDLFNNLKDMQATQQDILTNGNIKERIEANAKLSVINDIIKNLDF